MAFEKPQKKKQKTKLKNNNKEAEQKSRILMFLAIISVISFCIFLYCFYYLFSFMKAINEQMKMEQDNPIQTVFDYILQKRTDYRSQKNSLNYLVLLQNYTRNTTLRQDIIDYSLNSSLFPYFYEEIHRHSQRCLYLEDQNVISNILETLLALFTLNEPKMIKCDANEYFQLLPVCYRSSKVLNLVFDCLISHIKLGCRNILQILIQTIQEKDVFELREESLNFFTTFMKSQMYDGKYNQISCNYIESLQEYSEDMSNDGQEKLANLSRWCSKSNDL